MQKSKTVKTVVPPRLSFSPLSNKYRIILNLKWGSYEKEISMDLERGSGWNIFLKDLNDALLEGSEAEPLV